MFQIPQNIGMSESMGSIADSVPKISNMTIPADKCMVVPAKIYVTINDPITLDAPEVKIDKPKLITDGKDESIKSNDKSFIGDLKKALGMKPNQLRQ